VTADALEVHDSGEKRGVNRGKDKLKPRQKRAVEAFVGQAKGNKTAALKAAGYPKSVAESQTGREWTPDMQAYARELLDKEGITDAVVVAKHKQLMLRSKVPVVYKGKITAWVADNDVQARMVQLAYGIRGLLKPETNLRVVVDMVVNAMIAVVVEYVPKEKQAAALDAMERNIIVPKPGATAG
jgi:hypothetical protein